MSGDDELAERQRRVRRRGLAGKRHRPAPAALATSPFFSRAPPAAAPPSAAGTVSVTDASGNFGISATTVNGVSTYDDAQQCLDPPSVTTTALVSSPDTIGSNNIGIRGTASGAGSITIRTGNNNSITVEGDNSYGVSGASASGDVTIATGATSNITVNPNTSVALENTDPASFPGNASIGLRGSIAGGAGNIAISTGGDITVANGAGGLTHGIAADVLGTGNVAITTGGSITVTGASGSTGITESTTSGTGMIIVNAAVSATNSSGISLASTAGNVALENNNVITGRNGCRSSDRFVSAGGVSAGALQLQQQPGAVVSRTLALRMIWSLRRLRRARDLSNQQQWRHGPC
jgi:hypothetical protein